MDLEKSLQQAIANADEYYSNPEEDELIAHK